MSYEELKKSEKALIKAAEALGCPLEQVPLAIAKLQREEELAEAEIMALKA